MKNLLKIISFTTLRILTFLFLCYPLWPSQKKTSANRETQRDGKVHLIFASSLFFISSRFKCIMIVLEIDNY